MNAIVLDCSAVVPWFFPEKNDEVARRVHDRVDRHGIGLIAPELLKAEFGNVAWKKVVKGQCSEELAVKQIGHFLHLPVVFCALAPLLPSALKLACAKNITVYDAFYLELARTARAFLATADEKLISCANDLGIGII
ncbi:MAG: type II toxin-antitoxin system VapC family toxin [Chitinivibrionales bacterium]|nr:type II toxin-antitoxin system VapC family toxin [Chitinivibrionales bacterium]